MFGLFCVTLNYYIFIPVSFISVHHVSVNRLSLSLSLSLCLFLCLYRSFLFSACLILSKVRSNDSLWKNKLSIAEYTHRWGQESLYDWSPILIVWIQLLPYIHTLLAFYLVFCYDGILVSSYEHTISH